MFYRRTIRMSILKRNGIPGPTPQLIFGNLRDYNSKGYNECFEIWKKKYGRVFGYYLGAKPFVVVTDPELLKLIQIKDFQQFSSRPYIVPGGIYHNWKYHQMVM
jgi:cytochrome P450 family 3 subfamily A